MCVYMCVCIYVCVYMCVCVYIYVCVYVCEPEGKGKMIYANSKVVEGKWKKGKKAFFG